VSPNARERNAVSDQRLDTLIHMQYPASVSSATAVKTPAAWELVVRDGRLTVDAIGDTNTKLDYVDVKSAATA